MLESVDAGLPFSTIKIMARQKFQNVAEKSVSSPGHVIEYVDKIIQPDGARIDFAADRRVGNDRFQFRGKAKRAAGRAIIYRLDADAVARNEQLFLF